MTDPGAPVTKHLDAASVHLRARRARRERHTVDIAAWLAQQRQERGETPTPPPTEATPK